MRNKKQKATGFKDKEKGIKYGNLVTSEIKIPVIVPDEFSQHVQYTCNEIPEREWIGIVFYELKGSTAQPKSLTIILKEILVLEIGSKSHTNFRYDKRFTQFILAKKERLKYKTGLIHSHNTFGTFFSRDDWEELYENSDKFNFYFSLIVNNAGDYTAKLSIPLKPAIDNVPYTALDENGNKYSLEITAMVESHILVYDTILKYEKPVYKVEKEFEDSIKALKKQKGKVQHNPNYNNSSYADNPFNSGLINSMIPGMNRKPQPGFTTNQVVFDYLISMFELFIPHLSEKISKGKKKVTIEAIFRVYKKFFVEDTADMYIEIYNNLNDYQISTTDLTTYCYQRIRPTHNSKDVITFFTGLINFLNEMTLQNY